MISWIGATFIVLCFIILMRLSGMIEKSHDVVTIARQSLGVVKNSDLRDEAKETILQNDAKRLLGLFLYLSCSGAAAVFLPIGFLWVCDQGGLLSLELVLETALSPLFIIISSVLTMIVLWNPFAKPSAEQSDYSFWERSLHKLAFSTYGSQIALADLEDRLFAKELKTCSVKRPVFITALPRAGTTLLLECFSGLEEFSSHSYRDMPFILIPCLWNRFSKIFQQRGTLKERAHGDGMLIDFDSPEALEEVVWQAFHRDHYRNDRIVLWRDIEDDEFEEFFQSHMKKIILLRRKAGMSENRYISKNNLNIARVQLLRKMFPDSVIVVPFRHPLQHVTSLLLQHRNFLKIHGEDPFARDYMRDIGHFDFGENLCPVDFDGWLERQPPSNAKDLSFWLEYWVATYKHLLGEKGDIIFINYEELCVHPAIILKRLAQAVGCENMDGVLAVAKTIHSPREREVETENLSEALVEEAVTIHSSLLELSL